MSQIKNLRYVTKDGLEAPVDTRAPDCPFYGDGQKSKLGLRVANSVISKLRWESDSKRRELAFRDDIMAAHDPVTDLIVVNTTSMGADVPNNAIVVNPDGSLNHQVIVPLHVEQTLAGKIRECPVERITAVWVEDGRVVIGLRFGYEWVERRFYDTSAKQWQERDQIYRH